MDTTPEEPLTRADLHAFRDDLERESLQDALRRAEGRAYAFGLALTLIGAVALSMVAVLVRMAIHS